MSKNPLISYKLINTSMSNIFFRSDRKTDTDRQTSRLTDSIGQETRRVKKHETALQ